MKILNILFVVFLISAFCVFGEDTLNMTENQTTSENVSVNMTNTTIIEEPEPIEEEPISDFNVLTVVPSKFNIGDIQFNIQVQNNGTAELNNLVAIVSGDGFSTYDIMPIDTLKPGEKSYILVMGNSKQEGNIKLTIKINDKTFYNNITIKDPDAKNETVAVKVDEKELENLSARSDEIEKRYKELEDELQIKKNNDYDVSNVDLEDLKKFLRDAQSYIIQEDIEKSRVSVTLAENEYEDQKDNLDSAQMIKRSVSSILKDNAVLMSTLAGSIIAFFSLYELLKKKKESLYQKIREVQINKDTKVIVEKKRKKKGEKGSEG